MNKHNPRNPNRRAVEKRVAEIEAHYMKRVKKLDATFAAGYNSNPFLSAYKSYDIYGIDSLVVGHFGGVNKGFKQLIYSLAKVAAESQEAENITPASSTDHKRKGVYALFKERFEVALGCMAIRTKIELMIRWIQFITNQKKLPLRQHALEIPEDIIQNMGIHGLIIGKMTACIICFDHVTIATAPLRTSN